MNYSICVSGAAAGKTVEQSRKMAERLGKAIAKSGNIITTGATVGLPFFAARAAFEAKGISIGFSPAASLREHVHKYRLPIGMFTYINYTGMNYVGRDVYLVQSSDAIITVGGRFGSLHEFSTAIELDIPCGVLLGTGGTADLIPGLMEEIGNSHRNKVVYDENPEILLEKILAMLDKNNDGLETEPLIDQWFLDVLPVRSE